MWQISFKDELNKLAKGAMKHMPLVISKFKYKHPLNQLRLDNPGEHARLMADSKALQKFLREKVKWYG
jgi:hypothetical protein